MYVFASLCLYASHIHEYQNKNNYEIDFKEISKEELYIKNLRYLQILTDTYLLIYLH